MGEMLSVKNINVFYGSIHAIRDVSFHVDEGEIVTPDRRKRRRQNHNDARDFRPAETAQR